MRLFSTPLKFPAAAPGVGVGQLVRDMREKWIQFAGTPFGGSYSVEVSFDNGLHYTNIGGAAISAAGLVSVPHPATHVRLNATALGAPGSTVAVLNGWHDAE